MTQPTNFSKFVPGFDFLQNFAKGTGLSNWVAPTLSVEELEKRISELKTVNFWLEQNSRALSATIQALEVQKMTLSTLKDMNVNIGDMAKNLQANLHSNLQNNLPTQATETPESTETPAAAAAAAAVDPLQLWNALAGQFQQIASTAFKPETEAQPKATPRTSTRKKAGN